VTCCGLATKVTFHIFLNCLSQRSATHLGTQYVTAFPQVGACDLLLIRAIKNGLEPTSQPGSSQIRTGLG